MKNKYKQCFDGNMIVRDVPIERKLDARVVRLFISSTFLDMQAERDELVKYVFPDLRKRCNERGIEFSNIDLRWGITSEQVAEGKVLPICLSEIDRCRPYFLCILGEYYGHVLEEIGGNLLHRFPWLVDYHGCSVTELEIVHGALNNPGAAYGALFFFRSKDFLNGLPEQQKSSWRSTGQHATKIASLKKRIRDAGFNPTAYSSPSELRKLVMEQLWAIIDADYPHKSFPNELEQERFEHEAFAKRHTRFYAGLEKNFACLDAHVMGTGPPLVVCGSAGVGKSALLANWIQVWCSENQDVPIISHFVDANPKARDPSAMLRRIINELIEKSGVHYDIPDNPLKLSMAFIDLLHLIPHSYRMVLVLDGVSELLPEKQLPNLIWLPPEVPENIRIILSIRPGHLYKDLERHNHTLMQIDALRSEECSVFIREFLKRQGRNLNDKNLKRISKAPQAASPLFLRVVLEELSVFGIYKIEKRIEECLQAHTIEELYCMILKRWKVDYERDVEGLVRNVMTLLWASRSGLPESDLLWMLRQNNDPLPAHYWSPLFLAADEVLVQTSLGYLHFANEYLHRAVEKMYIDQETAKTVHRKISDYYSLYSTFSIHFVLSEKYRKFVNDFSKMLDCKYRKQVEELPWQYIKIEEWDNLFTMLKDLKFLHAIYMASALDARRYWTLLMEKGYSIIDAYSSVIKHPEKTESEVLRTLVSLMTFFGHMSQAQHINNHLSVRFRNEENWTELGSLLLEKGNFLRAMKDLDEALAILQEAECVFGEQDDHYGTASAIHDQGAVLFEKGEIEAAIHRLNKAKLIFQSERLLRPLGIAYNSLGAAFASKGIPTEAMRHLKRAETIHRKVGQSIDLGRVLLNQGLVLIFRGDPDDALMRFKEAEILFKEAGNQEEAANCRAHQEVLTSNINEIRGFMRKHLKKK